MAKAHASEQELMEGLRSGSSDEARQVA